MTLGPKGIPLYPDDLPDLTLSLASRNHITSVYNFTKSTRHAARLLGVCPATVRRCLRSFSGCGDLVAGEGDLTLAKCERDHILAVLTRLQGIRVHAARALGISVSALRYRLSAYRAQGYTVSPPISGTFYRTTVSRNTTEADDSDISPSSS